MKPPGIVHTDSGEYTAKTIVVASGASHAGLGVPGEKRLAGKGVSYCALCDGAFFKNKVVAVVGSGNTAVEDACYLAGLCEKVYVINRSGRLRAEQVLQEKLYGYGNIKVLMNTEVIEICAESSPDNRMEKVAGIRLSGKNDAAENELKVSGVFIAVGITPNTGLLKDIVQTDEKGYVIAGEDCETSIEGIYAAGDIRRKPLRQIITAVADGANAAASAKKRLNKQKMS